MGNDMWANERIGTQGCNSGKQDISGRRKWQPTPVFLPRESCGQRRLVGYCP